MLWRYIKAQLFVLLCGGLVGPIFLGAYFVLGKSSYLQWMFWAGLAVTAIDVFAALAIASHGASTSRRTRFLEQQGVLALAQVVGVGETGTTINDQPLVKLDLRIEGPGVAPFAVQDRVIASIMRLPSITARRLVALVDPATNSFRIDWERSALINGTVPATFHIEEDNFTYDLSGQVGPLMEILQLLKANNIALNNMVDVRSNPVVRAQLRDIVRRAAAQARPPSAPVADAKPLLEKPSYARSPNSSVSQRLQELETLRAMGTITSDEYAEKRRQIIAEL